MATKLFFLLNCILLATSQVTQGQSWDFVGDPCFTERTINCMAITVDNSGVPYVIYGDGIDGDGVYNGKATVVKYVDGNWVSVGSSGFSVGEIQWPSIEVGSDGTLYVAYAEWGISQHATVMKYNGSDWVPLGSQGFTAGAALTLELALGLNDTPYITYSDLYYNGKASVMKYDGVGWVYVGNPAVSDSQASYTSIAIDRTGKPYIAYRDNSQQGKATVLKYSSGNWVPVGSPGFTSGTAKGNHWLAIDSSGYPYVAYQDGNDTFKTSVMRFNGSTWNNIGDVGFSAGSTYYPTIVISKTGEAYVAYQDGSDSAKATVKKFNGSSWETVGTPGFTPYGFNYDYYSLLMDITSDGTPYITIPCSSGPGNWHATVMKYGFPAELKSAENTSASLSVFPTPNRGKFTIYISSAITEKTIIYINSLLGNVIKHVVSTTNTANEITLDVPNGIYILSAATTYTTVNSRITIEK